MKRVAAIILAFFIGTLSPSVWALGKDDAGTTGAVFLKINPGERSSAMGDAFTGVADDIHAIYWNPAGLGTITKPEILGTHTEYFQSTLYEFAAFAYPTEEHGTWGLAVSNLHTSNIDRRVEDTDDAIGQFSSNDYAYWLSYATKLTSQLSIGANAKYIREVLDTADASAFAVDGGLRYDTDWKDIRLGATVQNVGTKIKFIDESDPLPLQARLGVSAPVLLKNLRLSSDLILPRDHQAGLAFGGEYVKELRDHVSYALRAGYQTDEDVSGLNGLSAGAGLEFARFGFDFAWTPDGDLGNTYQYSLHIKFGAADSDHLNASDRNLQNTDPVH